MFKTLVEATKIVATGSTRSH